MVKRTFLLICSMLLLSSCATIMHGTKQSVGISSNPSNANVWLDRQYCGTTPLLVDMSRKDNHIVSLQLDGYQPYEVIFSRQLSGWVFGNVVFGGIIGLAVDAISGGIYRLTPEQIEAQLILDNVSFSKKSADSYVAIVLEVDPSWEKIGQLAKN